MQIIDITTWSRSIKGILKQSLLDHVYVSNFAMVKNVDFEVPIFGDHVLVKVKLICEKASSKNIIKTKRAWSKYSTERICKEFNDCNLPYVTSQCSDAVVQEHWNIVLIY